MNCHKHPEKVASAICVNCGIAICIQCIMKTKNGKIVCSDECNEASMLTDRALYLITSKFNKTNNATAWFCWLLGGLFFILGLPTLFSDKFFAAYLLIGGAIFIGAGFWYNKIAKNS